MAYSMVGYHYKREVALIFMLGFIAFSPTYRAAKKRGLSPIILSRA